MQIGYELTLLSVYGFLVAGLILLQAALATRQHGIKYMAGPRDKRERLCGFAGRADRCAQNSITALALFAPAVLSVQLQGQNSGATMVAAQVFVIARFVYAACYMTGIAYLRTGAFGLGLAATLFLYLAAI